MFFLHFVILSGQWGGSKLLFKRIGIFDLVVGISKHLDLTSPCQLDFRIGVVIREQNFFF